MFGNADLNKPKQDVFAIKGQEPLDTTAFYQKPKFWGILSVVLLVVVGGILMFREASKPMTDTAIPASQFASNRSDNDDDHYSSSGKLAKQHSHYILSDGFHG